MRARQPRRPRPPLDEAALKELGLAYVARFATSRGKLTDYLRRKLRERGWGGEGEPPVASVVEWATNAGFVDDRAYALAKAQSLGARGYGERRVGQALRAAGIEEDDGAAARDLSRDNAEQAALRFARRKRIGPYGLPTADRRDSERAMAAMIRAGHSFELAKRVLALPSDFDSET
jgi:regulatory protein